MSDPFPMESLFGPPLPFKQGAMYVTRTWSKDNEQDRLTNEYSQVEARVITALEEVARRDDWVKGWLRWSPPISLDIARLRRASDLEGMILRRRVRSPDGSGDDGPSA
jgi:hypothetical protein